MISRVIRIDHVGGIGGIQKILDNNPTWRFVGGGCTECSDKFESGGVGGRPKILSSGTPYVINYAVFETTEKIEFKDR